MAAFALTAAPAFAQQQQQPPGPAGTPNPPAAPSPRASVSPSPSPTPGPAYGNLSWREVGPASTGGRVAAVAGSASDPKLYYVGAAGGGVWKTVNGGQTWDPVFTKQKVSAIGAVAIDPSNNDVVWAGTGESNPRNDVSYGDGVYKTVDGGKTWTRMGLEKTRHISRILVDPKNSNHVIVGALGDVFHDSEDRGVYVTEDGGKTWSKTLYVGLQSGASDLAMDVTHPNVVYAGIWQFRREPWTFHSGGKDDGLFKSVDGGRTWSRISGNGFPEGDTGRIGLAVAPSNGNRVYAVVEAKGGILWRSDDAGKTWTLVSKDTLVDQRPFYFSHVEVDPKNPDKVYAVSMWIALSKDAGKTFKQLPEEHPDNHAIWIAPNDPNRIIVGEDGGYVLTTDGGEHGFFSQNLPIAQIYHVGLSNENPYTLCIGLQDNNAWCGPSNSLDPSGILGKHWIGVNGGDGMWALPDPVDPNWIWSDSQGGALVMYNKATQDQYYAQPYLQLSNEAFDLRQSKYRFNWDSPIAFAPWDGHVAWLGGNVIFQTADRGRSWKIISPDLTRNEKSHQIPPGGPVTNDVSGAEYSDTILDIEGSTLRKGEIWAGTDDGLVQLTRDNGKHWTNVTPKGVPEWGRVETVAPSTLVAGTAYMQVDRHRSGDYKPYAFVTHDYGKHWTSIVNGLPADQYVRTVRPDLHNRNVVYAGTENGMWLSLDGAKSWVNFNNNLPTVSVRDIRMQPQFDDLVIATHGRATYIMDDIRPLQELQGAIAKGAALFKPRDGYEYSLHSNDEGNYTNYAAANPPYGVIIQYYQKTPQKNAPKLEILDARGRVIRTVAGTRKVEGEERPRVPNKAGLNRYVWDFQIDGPVKWTGAAKEEYQGPNEGPGVPPGRYSVRMNLNGTTFAQAFSVKPDPRSKFTQADYERTFEFARKAMATFSNVDSMLNALDSAKKQLDSAAADAKKTNNTDLQAQIDAALTAREAVRKQLTADFHNDEDSIQQQGALREDLQGLFYASQGLVTPPNVEYAQRIDAEYQSARKAYNGYIGSLKNVSGTMQKGGLKPLTGLQPVR